MLWGLGFLGEVAVLEGEFVCCGVVGFVSCSCEVDFCDSVSFDVDLCQSGGGFGVWHCCWVDVFSAFFSDFVYEACDVLCGFFGEGLGFFVVDAFVGEGFCCFC